jgi:hypothetical protein
VLSGACGNALAESESTLQSSRGGWKDLEVLWSTGEGYRGDREVCISLPDRITFCWCTLNSNSESLPKFMWPQNNHDGKHTDAMIKDFWSQLDNTQGATHHVATYFGIQEFIQDKSCDMMYISDEELSAIKFCIYNGVRIQVQGLERERISPMCRCTGSQNCCGGGWRNHWMWVKQCVGWCYGVLNGHLPWQLQLLFKITLLNKDAAFIVHWLSLTLTTICEIPSNLDPISKFEQVRNALTDIAFQVFSVGILSAARQSVCRACYSL